MDLTKSNEKPLIIEQRARNQIRNRGEEVTQGCKNIMFSKPGLHPMSLTVRSMLACFSPDRVLWIRRESMALAKVRARARGCSVGTRMETEAIALSQGWHLCPHRPTESSGRGTPPGNWPHFHAAT